MKKNLEIITDESKYESIVFNIRKSIKTYLIKNKLKSLVIGVSGGIDSALCCVLLKPICDELNIPIIGRSISIKTNKIDEIKRANVIGECFCSNFYHIDLCYDFEYTYSTYNRADDICIEQYEKNNNKGDVKKIFQEKKIRGGNIKARMRMIYLYDLAHKNNGMVISTDNLTEYYLGFFTIFGDQGDYSPIQFLWKTEVYNISLYLAKNMKCEKSKKALEDCIFCDATDGLGITNTDLDQILVGENEKYETSKDGYFIVDSIFIKYFKNKIHKNHSVIKRYNATKFKRNHPVQITRKHLLK